MIAVIFAGGRGSRLQELTEVIPKPLVEVCGKPLIWHVMSNYALHGIEDFIILTGYKGHKFGEYFSTFWLQHSDITFNLSSPEFKINNSSGLDWKVRIIDTGVDSLTGTRLKKIQHLLDSDFLLTYGDGIADVNIDELLKQHNSKDCIVTLTAVLPSARFGAVKMVGSKVREFSEKPVGEGSRVNGGFFVLKKNVFDFISDSNESFESDVLPRVAKAGQLEAYLHDGFWQPVDTMRDLDLVKLMAEQNKFPWMS